MENDFQGFWEVSPKKYVLRGNRKAVWETFADWRLRFTRDTSATGSTANVLSGETFANLQEFEKSCKSLPLT